jgi:vancomycin permeability regulator SanA
MQTHPLRLLLRGAAAALILFALAALAIGVAGMRDEVVDTDLAVIPGNTVYPDGTLSPRLQGRLDAALGLYQGGHVKMLLVSGGIGEEKQDEAAAMQRYLIARGVPAKQIRIRGLGAAAPVGDNRTGVGRSLNRRVELHQPAGQP